MDENSNVLSFGAVKLFASDIALLQRPATWLNDNVLAFALEYFEREEFAELCVAKGWPAKR